MSEPSAEGPRHPTTAPDEAGLLIVIGAHPRAEAADRPLAYRLREAVRRWQRRAGADDVAPQTCTDLWYVNDRSMDGRPAVCIGAPEVNAATAMLGSRVPTAFVVEERLRIHLDPELLDLRACIWGVDPEATATGLDIFVDRYLDEYLRRAHDLPSG